MSIRPHTPRAAEEAATAIARARLGVGVASERMAVAAAVAAELLDDLRYQTVGVTIHLPE